MGIDQPIVYQHQSEFTSISKNNYKNNKNNNSNNININKQQEQQRHCGAAAPDEDRSQQ